MRNKILHILLAFSVAVNVSFAGSFLYFRYVLGASDATRDARSRVNLRGMDVEKLDRLFLQSLRGRLDLTEKQMEEMYPVVHEVHLKLHEIAGRLGEVEEQLYREATRPEVNAAALDEVHRRWLELRNRQHRLILETLLRIRKVLTAEQQERYFIYLETFFAKER